MVRAARRLSLLPVLPRVGMAGVNAATSITFCRFQGGATTADNLCLACAACNGSKVDRTEAVDPSTGKIEPLFNPLSAAPGKSTSPGVRTTQIIGVTPCGRATVDALRLLTDPPAVRRGRSGSASADILPREVVLPTPSSASRRTRGARSSPHGRPRWSHPTGWSGSLASTTAALPAVSRPRCLFTSACCWLRGMVDPAKKSRLPPAAAAEAEDRGQRRQRTGTYERLLATPYPR